jgi:hypothetical protein
VGWGEHVRQREGGWDGEGRRAPFWRGGRGEQGRREGTGGVAAVLIMGVVLLCEVCLSGGQGRLPTLPSSSALLPPGAVTMSEFVPGSDQRLSKVPRKHVAGEGFYPAASSTFKLFDETLNAQGKT